MITYLKIQFNKKKEQKKMPSIRDTKATEPKQKGTHRDVKRIGSAIKSYYIRNNGNIQPTKLNF